jgi:hypothetical protein
MKERAAPDESELYRLRSLNPKTKTNLKAPVLLFDGGRAPVKANRSLVAASAMEIL